MWFGDRFNRAKYLIILINTSININFSIMNKKFSTLAAVFLAASALSTSAVANVTNGNYYRLKYSTTTPTSTEKYLGVDIAKTDSVVLNSKATGSTVSAERILRIIC